MYVLVGFSLLCIAASSLAQNTLNVVDFGAIGDGQADDSAAFLRAWKALCEARKAMATSSTLIIPKGKTFLLQPVKFSGPCLSKTVNIQVLGEIIAPKSMAAWKTSSTSEFAWLQFLTVTNLIISGSGQIDGQGSSWWNYKDAADRPTALFFHQCENLHLSGLTHINSPRNHISINGCTSVFISNLRIIAPEKSPNTDGIDISQSSYVNIQNTYIGTGDDCVAIGGGSSNIQITGVVCGPGHGISVGSLGRYGRNDTVEEVHVQRCTFKGTQNGARIKTWQGGRGFARKITFEYIKLIATHNPIIIDQNYCNGAHNCQTNEASAVAVSDVRYSYFQGTSADMEAIKLDCNDKIGCTNILLDQINITSSVPRNQAFAFCKNVHGAANHTVIPKVPCLSSAGSSTV